MGPSPSLYVRPADEFEGFVSFVVGGTVFLDLVSLAPIWRPIPGLTCMYTLRVVVDLVNSFIESGRKNGDPSTTKLTN
jgi:hypothetical protein